jgi:hypothetical protein
MAWDEYTLYPKIKKRRAKKTQEKRKKQERDKSSFFMHRILM